MQKWEYRFERATRHWRGGLKTGWSAWEYSCIHNNLGSEGWELVSACPVSTSTGETWAGCTTMIIYAFKRPL